MEVLFEIIVVNILAHFFGVNTRYFFFKIIGKEKSREYLRGNTTNDGSGAISQYVFNIIIGIAVVFIIIISLMQIF